MSDSYVNSMRGQIKVNEQQIKDAFKKYNLDYPNNDYCDPGHKSWLEEDINRVGAYKWAVWHLGKCYPGKYIIRSVTGLSFDELSGGWSKGQVNYVLNELGFIITLRPELRRISR